ncbi:4Fe-4S dicluster domain-containing protein [Chloroflexota bacterium]
MAVLELPQLIAPNPSLRKRVEELSGQKVSACFQCEKCTNGCPVTFAMDIVPHKLMRLLQLGLKNEVLHSYTIWLCASCQTCTARCPNGIAIAHIMDTLRQIAQREGIKASQYNVPIFHSAFLSSLRRHGRVHETEMALTYAWEDEALIGILKLVGIGFAMFLRGKVKLNPSRVRAIGQVRNLFQKAKG